ncbi:hypothetical protein KHA80_00040 [Anaerobacillus sp. HL2]|nr:hypothetical protein KHA80_00040 [Anaerobacillus sp. HL2]
MLGNAAWVGTSMYFVGIAIIFLGALVVRRITGDKHTKSFFIMELPEYKIPSFKTTITTFSRVKLLLLRLVRSYLYQMQSYILCKHLTGNFKLLRKVQKVLVF